MDLFFIWFFVAMVVFTAIIPNECQFLYIRTYGCIVALFFPSERILNPQKYFLNTFFQNQKRAYTFHEKK